MTMIEKSPVKSAAIPLARFEAKPGSFVLAVFTREAGQLRVHSRGARSKKGGTPATLPQFSTFDLVLNPPRRSSGLYELKERQVRVSRPGLNAGRPFDTWGAASLLGDLVLRTTGKHDSHPYLFDMLDKALDCLEAGSPPDALSVSFFLKYLEHLGFRPRLDGCSCGAPVQGKRATEFNIPLGGLCCEKCVGEAHGTLSPDGFQTHFTLDGESLAILKSLRLARFDSLVETPIQTERLRDLMRLLGAYVEYHFETRLKSLGFWHDLHRMKEKPPE